MNPDTAAIIELIRETTDPIEALHIAGAARAHAESLTPARAAGNPPPRRRRGTGAFNEGGFVVGQTVKFSTQISPRYLVGREVVIQNTNAKSVVVDCPNDPGFGRFAGKSNVRCPNVCVVAV